MPTSVAGLERDAVEVLLRIDGLTCCTTTFQVLAQLGDELHVLPMVVERRHDLVAAFMAFGVIRIPAHDESLDAVVVGIDPCHTRKCALPGGVQPRRYLATASGANTATIATDQISERITKYDVG